MPEYGREYVYRIDVCQPGALGAFCVDFLQPFQEPDRFHPKGGEDLSKLINSQYAWLLEKGYINE